MKEFVEYILEKIVSDKDALMVEENAQETNIEIKVTVAPEDMGLIIGKAGRTIKSIRALARAKAIKDGVKVRIELVEPEGNNYQPPEDV